MLLIIRRNCDCNIKAILISCFCHQFLCLIYIICVDIFKLIIIKIRHYRAEVTIKLCSISGKYTVNNLILINCILKCLTYTYIIKWRG